MQPPALTFKEAFCDYFKVAPEKFVSAAVFKCLHPQAGFLFRLLYAMQTVTAQESIRFIEKVGDTRTDDELEDVISEYHNDIADMSTFFARGLNQRISARKVAQINQVIRGRQPDEAHDSTHYYRKSKSESGLHPSR